MIDRTNQILTAHPTYRRDDFWLDDVWAKDTNDCTFGEEMDSSLGDELPWHRPPWTNHLLGEADVALAKICGKKLVSNVKPEDVYRARKKGLKSLRSRGGCAIVGRDLNLLPLKTDHVDAISR